MHIKGSTEMDLYIYELIFSCHMIKEHITDRIGKSNLATKPFKHYGVYVLQLIWYSIVCVSYPDILDIAYYQGRQRGIFDSGENAYSSAVSNPLFNEVCVAKALIFFVIVCRPLFVFFFLSCFCLFLFDLWLLLTPLMSSNLS